MEWLDHIVVHTVFLGKLHMEFVLQKWLYQFIFPPAIVGGFPFLYTLSQHLIL